MGLRTYTIYQGIYDSNAGMYLICDVIDNNCSLSPAVV